MTAGTWKMRPVLVAAMPPYGQAVSELPQPEPALTVLPETKVLASAKPKGAVSEPKRPVSPDGAAVALPHPRPRDGSATATPTSHTTATHSTRHVGTGKPGSTGTDAVTSTGSSGNAGGGQVDQAPSAVASNPVPPYPPDALARGIEGLVLLRVRIGADGVVEEASIDRTSGTTSLDESALSTVRRQWRFVPATRCSVAVSYEAILPIRFTIRAG